MELFKKKEFIRDLFHHVAIIEGIPKNKYVHLLSSHLQCYIPDDFDVDGNDCLSEFEMEEEMRMCSRATDDERKHADDTITLLLDMVEENHVNLTDFWPELPGCLSHLQTRIERLGGHPVCEEWQEK
jgi:hypothetical protein